MARPVWLRILAALLCLPAAASAVIVLSVPPVARLVPDAAADALAPLADLVFEATARLPPDSLAGRAFYGSYAPLPALFGSAALAAHAVMMALPWVAASAGLAAWSRSTGSGRRA